MTRRDPDDDDADAADEAAGVDTDEADEDDDLDGGLTADEEDLDDGPESFPPPNLQHALAAVLVMTIAIGVAFSSRFAFEKAAFAILVAVFGAAAVYGVMRSRVEGRASSLRLKSGDLTVGAFTAALLYALVLGGHPLVFPRGQARELLFLLAYVPLVDPLSDGRHVVAVAAGVLCGLEELALRSFVQPALARRFSDLAAWAATVVLDVIVWAPTLVLLADPRVGWNPVYVGFAAGVAFVTGYLRLRTDRVAPSVLTRMLLGWALIEFPVWAP